MSALRLVLFDFDGTLVDSHRGIFAALSEAWQAHGLGTPDPAATRRQIGLPLVEAIARGLPDGERHRAADVAETYKLAMRAMQARGEHHDPLFAGARAAIEALDAAGLLLGIATSKGRRGLTAALERHGFARRFSVLRTPDDGPGKPHPFMVESAMAALGVAPADTVVIGDTTFDMQMARNARVAAIGAGWGYHAAEELLDAGAACVADSFEALLPALDARGFLARQ